MSLVSSISIAVSGMTAATRRLEASAANVANVGTTGAMPANGQGATSYQPVTVSQTATANGGVSARIVPSNSSYIAQYDPQSPDADADGMIAAPDVDLAGEMVNQLMAKISYGAAVRTLKTADEMMKSTIDMAS